LLGSSTSQRLGGTSASASSEVVDKNQLRRLALDAAEQRRKDNNSCASVFEGVDQVMMRATKNNSGEVIAIDLADDQTKWQCSICTLINISDTRSCQACGAQKGAFLIEIMDDTTEVIHTTTINKDVIILSDGDE
jgi:hypothetical protein